jgi:rRNA maturation endonuclease Nob1
MRCNSSTTMRMTDMVKKIERVLMRCVACKCTRSITNKQLAKGPSFCPRCGNVEAPVKLELIRG